MYKVAKILNHNAILAIKENGIQEYLLMGKGIGFGKKISETIEAGDDCRIYSLMDNTNEGTDGAKQLIKKIDPMYFEISNVILDRAEKEFGRIDRSIMFPMADHIAFAAQRIKNGEAISNPLTQDIKILFYKEYKIASMVRPLLKNIDNIDVEDDEIGYLALHVHSAICDDKVSNAMIMAGSVRECITLIENDSKKHIDVQTMSYNLLMNHIKYMVARAIGGEDLKFDMNDYIRQNFPKAFEISKMVCNHLSEQLNRKLHENEIGYLAIHIARVYSNDDG